MLVATIFLEATIASAIKDFTEMEYSALVKIIIRLGMVYGSKVWELMKARI